jgi:hypothetical protein
LNNGAGTQVPAPFFCRWVFELSVGSFIPPAPPGIQQAPLHQLPTSHLQPSIALILASLSVSKHHPAQTRTDDDTGCRPHFWQKGYCRENP